MRLVMEAWTTKLLPVYAPVMPSTGEKHADMLDIHRQSKKSPILMALIATPRENNFLNVHVTRF